MRKTRAIGYLLCALCILLLFPPGATGQYFWFGKNKVNYYDFKWRLYESPHFDIYYYEAEEHLLNDVLNYIESSYVKLSEAFDHELEKRIPVIVFKSHGEFEQTHILPFFIPEGVAGFSEPFRNRLVMPLDRPPTDTSKTFTHELAHIFSYSLLYGGSLSRIYRSQVPGWFMEGLAEHMAEGYTTIDEMLVRDLVINDLVPPLRVLSQISGYTADYVLGQVIMDYLVDKKGGRENLRDFVTEVRQAGGRGLEKAMMDIYQMEYEQFDRGFRRHLRDRYLHYLTEKKEPMEYGYELKPKKKPPFPIFSPVISPSGEVIAALTVNYRERVLDLGLFSTKDGDRIKNLTGGYSRHYEYIIGQGLTVSDGAGRDMAWTPDGDELVFLGRTENMRTLFFMNVTNGKITRRIKPDLNQVLSPDISPDGKKILLSGVRDGIRDIYILSLNDESLTNVTQDDFYEFSPVWSPDGNFIVFCTDINGRKKLFKMDPGDPSSRVQLTFGEWNDVQPAFSRDGSKLFFSSDRKRISNIYALNLDTGEISQFTDVYTGCFTPSEIQTEEDSDNKDILFSGFFKGQFHLYRMTLDNPIETFPAGREFQGESMADFEPALKLELDESKKRDKPLDLNIDDIYISGGIASDGTVLSYSFVNLSDLLSNHFMQVYFSSINTFGNFGFTYLNQTKRFIWGTTFFREKRFFLTRPVFDISDLPEDIDELTISSYGGSGVLAYPFDKFHRIQFTLGAAHREYSQGFLDTFFPGVPEDVLERFKSGTFVPMSVSFVGDSSRFDYYGPFAGRRYRIDFQYAPDFGDSTIGFQSVGGDFRNYLQVTKDSLLAFRFFGAYSWGEAPSVYFFGGTDTLRGYNYLSFAGSRAFFVNTEYRFPLVDALKFPKIPPFKLRGLVFFDLGAAWYEDQDFSFFEDGEFRLADPRASFGFGFSLNLGYFDLNWTFSKLTDLRSVSGGFEVDFYIGQKF